MKFRHCVRFVVYLLVFIAALSLLQTSIVYAETEPNDISSQANTLNLGVTGDMNATLSSNADVDWYKMTLTQDNWHVFETYNVSPNLSTKLEFYDTNGTIRLAVDYSSGTGNTRSRIAWQAPASGSYYLRVSSSSGAGPYSIRALQKYDEGATWDGFHEPNDTWQTAHLIKVGRQNAVSTTIYPRGPYTTSRGEYDYFYFNAELGHWYVIETYNVAPILDTRITLFDINASSHLDSDYYGGTGNKDARIVWQAPQSGTFTFASMLYLRHRRASIHCAYCPSTTKRLPGTEVGNLMMNGCEPRPLF